MAKGSLSVQMKELLDELDENVQKAMEDGMQSVARQSVAKLKSTSPRKTGAYSKGWRAKKVDKKTTIIHNSTNYQLTHLLENGHVIRNKKGTYGRAPGIPHIKPVEEWASDELPRKITEGIK